MCTAVWRSTRVRLLNAKRDPDPSSSASPPSSKYVVAAGAAQRRRAVVDVAARVRLATRVTVRLKSRKGTADGVAGSGLEHRRRKCLDGWWWWWNRLANRRRRPRYRPTRVGRGSDEGRPYWHDHQPHPGKGPTRCNQTSSRSDLVGRVGSATPNEHRHTHRGRPPQLLCHRQHRGETSAPLV